MTNTKAFFCFISRKQNYGKSVALRYRWVITLIKHTSKTSKQKKMKKKKKKKRLSRTQHTHNKIN